jgi:phytol kinase
MILRILLASSSFLVLFGVVEFIYAKFKISKELSRKLIHIFSAFIIAVLPIWLNYFEIGVAATMFVPVLWVSKKYNIFKAIHTGERSTLGEVYYPIAILIICIIRPIYPEFLYVVLVLGISDGLAAIVGKQYGKKHFSILNSHKSYLGSFIFFLSAITIGIILLYIFGALSIISIAYIVLLSALLTFVEATSSNGLDNLFVPIIGLVAIWFTGIFR